ncbi:MAG: asparagine synthase-related protein [Acidobacteriota bacterium]
MCSIIGTYWFSPVTDDTLTCAALRRALGRLQRRGPDQKYFARVDDRCILAGNRLIIRGDSNVGRLPFRDLGVVATYNGEIYNSRRRVVSESADGSAMIPAYREFGEAFASQLDGEFAIALWDEKLGQLLLARDAFGTKPLYFGFDKTRLVWASSAYAVAEVLQRSYCRPTHGPAYQHTYAIQEPYTSFSGVWALPPSHYLVVREHTIQVSPYESWLPDSPSVKSDDEIASALFDSLSSRLDHSQTIAIPMSAGIDSGILTFAAEQMQIPYHVFSLIEVFDKPTVEAPYIMSRLKRLKHASGITLVRFGDSEYGRALSELYDPCYYDSEYYDNGALLTHAVLSAIHNAGIRVIIDGSGGDELFDGYDFRADFYPPDQWPRAWQRTSFYSLFTTLLAYTSKVDRAGGFFSIESRFPFLSKPILSAALRCMDIQKKRPLRDFLLNRLSYGSPQMPDLDGKFGFSMRGCDLPRIRSDMRAAWRKSNGITADQFDEPLPYPFLIGASSRMVVSDNIPTGGS